MQATPYSREDVLPTLIEDYPEVLALDSDDDSE
jgi:hypothetical protein